MAARIVFQSEYASLAHSVASNSLESNARGGTAYEYDVLRALNGHHHVSVDPSAVRRSCEGSASYLLRLHRTTPAADVVILTPSVIVHGRRSPRQRTIGIIHHVYLEQKNRTFRQRLSLEALHRRSRRLDCIVTVSQFWQRYFERVGCRNVRTIYNAFDAEEYAADRDEIDAFRDRFGLPYDRPLVYIGVARDGKGAERVYRSLRGTRCTMIMTGEDELSVPVPVRRLLLDRRDYIRLLHAADVSILMSTAEEGWSRVAHESLLCRTPVIGSGVAGMRELLDSGMQLICPEPEQLPGMVEDALDRREVLGDAGYRYVTQLTLDSFGRQWRSLVREIAG